MNPIEIERDMPECEKHNIENGNVDDEAELQREVDDNYLRDAMQEMI